MARSHARSPRPPALSVAVALAAIAVTPALAYLKFGVTTSQGTTFTLKWARFPVRYFLTDRGVPGVSAAQFRTTVERAFRTWQDVPTSGITYEFAGFTSVPPGGFDGVSTLGFRLRPDLPRVLGATSFIIDRVSGDIIESDIFFNETFAWSVASSGEADRFDLESIALHEIGHLSGLSHSQLGETELRPGGRRVLAAEAVMFPIAFSAGTTADRTLRADDIAGVSDLYPDGNFKEESGTIRGRVTKNGRGVNGAHVIAFNVETGKLVAGFTLNNSGEFTINGLDAGAHVVRVEPLDDAEIESFFSASSGVDIDFQVAYAASLVVAPRGGASESVEITVRPK